MLFKQTFTKSFSHKGFEYVETTTVEFELTEKNSDLKPQTSKRQTLISRVMIIESLMSFCDFFKEPIFFFFVFIDSKLNYLPSQLIDTFK